MIDCLCSVSIIVPLYNIYVLIIVVYGHIVIVFKLSDSFFEVDLFKDALNSCGEALLLRVDYYGIIHCKTAQCHMQLGILYRHLNDYEQSRQELFICK